MRALPLGRGSLIGSSELVYQVFAAPLNRNIFTCIVSYLADSTGEATIDVYRLSFTCAFLRRWTNSYKQVDSPSVESVASPSVSAASASLPPSDVEYW